MKDILLAVVDAPQHLHHERVAAPLDPLVAVAYRKRAPVPQQGVPLRLVAGFGRIQDEHARFRASPVRIPRGDLYGLGILRDRDDDHPTPDALGSRDDARRHLVTG